MTRPARPAVTAHACTCMVLKADTCSDANVNCLTRDVWDAYDDDSFKPDVRTSCREAFGPKEPELLDTDPKLVHDMAPHPCDRHMQSSTPDTPMDSGYWTVGTMMASPTAEDTEETRDNGDSGNAARRASPSTVIWSLNFPEHRLTAPGHLVGQEFLFSTVSKSHSATLCCIVRHPSCGMTDDHDVVEALVARVVARGSWLVACRALHPRVSQDSSGQGPRVSNDDFKRNRRQHSVPAIHVQLGLVLLHYRPTGR